MRQVSDEIEELLKGSGLPWSIEDGSKHLRVIVAGKFAAILPRARKGKRHEGRCHKNAIAQIRRVIRGVTL